MIGINVPAGNSGGVRTYEAARWSTMALHESVASKGVIIVQDEKTAGSGKPKEKKGTSSSGGY